ncbi:MAG: vanadium-dependent haloperoxidase [Leadbetterella sp.]
MKIKLHVKSMTFSISLVANLLFFNILASSQNVCTQWAKISLDVLKNTPNGSPTYNSRCLGYLGLTMYESLASGINSKHKSLFGYVNTMPKIENSENKLKIIPEIAISVSQAQMLRSLFPHMQPKMKVAIDSLEKVFLYKFSKKQSKELINNSIYFGNKVFSTIYEWSKSDGGHEGYLRNFDTTYIESKGRSKWNPPGNGQAKLALPLHPNWGGNRTFSKENYVLPIPKLIDTRGLKGSDYYSYMKEVCETGKHLTQEQKEIANWWGDDPGETFSPPGHSYNIAVIAAEKSKADIYTSSKTFAAVGMAVADAFINCWKTKYHYSLERPFKFIITNIDFKWELYWPEPPFPAFYSGHAGQSSSAATVLTQIYGDSFSFIDDSHVGRPNDEFRNVVYKARNFNSFDEAANESAESRIYGGIHTRLDNEVGLLEGKKIGQNINKIFESIP